MSYPFRSEAIAALLKSRTHPDLASLYSPYMEVQVMVSPGSGSRVDTGGTGKAYSDGNETWADFRMPKKAMTDPEANDFPLRYNLEEHCQGIGMTGWDFGSKVSRFFGYDFDAMIGHSDKHTKKLSPDQLAEVQREVSKLPFVTIRKSTSGKGLHLYVFVEPIPTANHTEHASLARAVLGYMSGLTGFSFGDKIDVCGMVLWQWHRKQIGTDGLALIRRGEILPASKVPQNWRDHVPVISRKATRTVLKFGGMSEEASSEANGTRARVQLDEDHLKMVQWLDQQNLPCGWDMDHHLLVTHTAALKQAHQALQLKGEFDTFSSGKDLPHDQNCWATPMRNGAWAVYRYGKGTAEHPLWSQDGHGHTRAFLNRPLGLSEAARMALAVETEQGGYEFPTAKDAVDALTRLGIQVVLPTWLATHRTMRVTPNKGDNRLLLTIPFLGTDKKEDMKGWLQEGKVYKRLVSQNTVVKEEESYNTSEFDHIVRHLTSPDGEDLGWVVEAGGAWRQEPLANVRLCLLNHGVPKKEVDYVLGAAVAAPWVIVNLPFQPEYPGDRQWNRSKARFAVSPTLDGENLSHPTWDRILSHCGSGLDEALADDPWAKKHGVKTGGQYLRMWLACLVKHPTQPLPFLAFHGPQNSGKSSFHETFTQFILAGGYMDGKTSLTSQAEFNGELMDAILITLEEVDLRNKTAYNRMKDWVTSHQLSIHIKGRTPYKATNYTHWVQCVNDRDYIPLFSGDTRVTVMKVDSLPEDQMIPKRELWARLRKEASDFLAALLATDIPDSRDRLMLPVIVTADKKSAEYNSKSLVEQFLEDQTYPIPGALTTLDNLWAAFAKWLGEDGVIEWNKQKMSKALPADLVKGKLDRDNQAQHIGNMSLVKGEPPSTPWVLAGTFIRRKTVAEQPQEDK